MWLMLSTVVYLRKAVALKPMLPIIASAALYLYYRHMRRSLEAPGWMVALLWVAVVFIIGFVVPSLATELGKMFR